MGFLPAGIEIKFEGIHPRCNSFQCSQKASFCSENGQYSCSGHRRRTLPVRPRRSRLQNSRFFFSKSVKKSVKCGVRVLRTRSARVSHARRACVPSLALCFQPRSRPFVRLLARTWRRKNTDCFAVYRRRNFGNKLWGINFQRPFFEGLYCWFARDVTAAMLVVKKKSTSLLGELESYFHVNFSRKKSIVLTPNMAALSRGWKSRIRSGGRKEIWVSKFHGLVIDQFRIKNYRWIQTLTTHSYRVSLDLK